MSSKNTFSVCVLCFGDHLELSRRYLWSIEQSLGEGRTYVADFRLGLNATSPANENFIRGWAEDVWRRYAIPTILYESRSDVFKYPLMRRMFHDPQRRPAERIMWFDDDSFLEGRAN